MAVHKMTKRWRKFRFYSSNVAATLMPGWWYRRQLPQLLASVSPDSHPDLFARRDYYCQITEPFALREEACALGRIQARDRHTYAFDFRHVHRHFDPSLRVQFTFGDVTWAEPSPTLTKSRPITPEPSSNVLLKWNQIRHYYLPHDPTPFSAKQDQAVWRGKSLNKPERIAFLKQYSEASFIDCGDTTPRLADTPLAKPFLTIPQQLQYRYILSIEGNDVATNTKWIMASNSLCMMAPPTCETWFMEGRLEPNVHYAALKPDLSDVEERMDHYRAHPDEAQTIIANAQRWVDQFRDQPREHLLQMLVLQRYLALSGQLG